MPNHAFSATTTIICAQNGWSKQIDVKLAKPRNATSPNFKAFSSLRARNSISDADLHPLKSQVKFRSETKDAEPMSPLIVAQPTPINQYTSYFSLGNTFRDEAKASYTDRLSAFVHRFSQQIHGNDPSIKLKQHMKRFSLEDKNAGLGGYYKKNEREDRHN